MTVKLRDFWQSHQSDYSPNYAGDITKDFLRDLARQIIQHDGRPIAITSVYKTHTLTSKLIARMRASKQSKQEMLYRGQISTPPSKEYFNIWYTAENIRPFLDWNYDAYLSYDLDSYMGINQYLPLWVCRLGPTTESANETQLALTQRRKFTVHRSKNFAVVASNPEQIRNHFIANLQKFEKVEIFGKLGKQISNKNEVLKDFNFNICFENDCYPGYVTEKAIEAYLSGCIPVWRGVDAGNFLNKDAIIDVTNMSVIDAIQEVQRISKDFELMAEMKSAPLLSKTIPLERVISNMQKMYQDK